ncbi:serine/threonine-protein kinase [Mycolicibacter sinensis]|uniref:serine/threonine-protein kinase n=1 Tax=Mycolicibacter sinensis (strain JDM601) TaxID=875328 RepID=UPI0002D7ECCA|nr:serine/threonine-protein kinase [Mycolicibacter sinensis]
MSLTIGEAFAEYQILRLLGSGGMGHVYLARHPRLPREDALKVLRPDVSSDTSFRERFIREADLAAGLRHPHIVGVHDRGEHDGQLWIAMDFIDGTDAAHLVAQHYPTGMPVDLVGPIVTAVASALDYAHKKGLLHRDVKPANIIVADLDTDDPNVFLADFGIARPLEETGGITTTNMTVGTVAYAAPEQLMGEYLNGRADQYALAATAYHLLTGSPLFPNSNPAVVISRHLNSAPPRLADHRPELAGLDVVLHAALAKNPDGRYTSCTAFARSLAGKSLGQAVASSSSAPTQLAPRPGRPVTEAAELSAGGQRTFAPPRIRSRRTWTFMGSATVATLLIGLFALVGLRSHNSDSTPTKATSAPARSTSAPTTSTAASWPSVPPPTRQLHR